MKPVDQDRFGVPGGNCFSACVATLLELPLSEVPYFMDDWPRSFDQWLHERGLYAMSFTLPSDPALLPRGGYILGGQSPRGSHAVVAMGAEIVHDPHPSRAGLDQREDFTLLLPLDPGVLGGSR